MDFSAISSVLQTIGRLLTMEVTSLWGVKDQVEDLQRELTWMQRFLKKVDARKLDDDVVRSHVAEIRELAYDAEDVIQTFALKVAPKKERRHFQSRITNLTRQLQTYKLGDEKSRDEAFSSYSNQRQELRRPYPHIPDENVVRLADDIKKLVSVLVDDFSLYVSICVLGGLGKTTLAKRIYHNSQVIDHFSRLTFAYVSQHCQKRKVWEGILYDLKILDEADGKIKDEALAKKLYDFLRKNKCLVIIDDIWSTDAWDLPKPAFPVIRDMRSKFLLTSRHREVVSHADRSGYLHELQCLNDKESWELFQKIAFRQTENTVYTGMEGLGKKMIHHCAGLPLAISH
ncbi:CC-NBS-LRR class disease resistance protein [Hibiscus syriacus]|uniref:CC-NBS-LRR class disease resistance protein n=1 Tax=Hibiscus syriacus TaxID=106335 RepID=A0A6A3AH55_HIBSY|nr:CC-NBS-LRR class disease resistance protein [Hibiscus syriacus]